jgi:hypothetical protein
MIALGSGRQVAEIGVALNSAGVLPLFLRVPDRCEAVDS